MASVPTPDYSHPDKFKVSIGLLLVMGAIAGTYFMFDAGRYLTLSNRVLKSLPQQSTEIIQQRIYLAGYAPWVWGLSAIFGVIIGIRLISTSLKNWTKRQESIDDSEERKRKAEFEEAPETQVQEDREVEVKDLAQSSEVGSGASTQIEVSSEQEDDETEEARLARFRQAREKINNLRSRLSKEFEQAYVRTSANSTVSYQAIPDVVVDEKRIDLLLRTETDFADIGFEFFFVRNDSPFLSAQFVPKIFNLAYATKSLSGRKVYTGKPGNPPRAAYHGVALVVLATLNEDTLAEKESRNKSRIIKAAAEKIREFNELSSSRIALAILDEKHLDQLTVDNFRSFVTETVRSGRSMTVEE